MKMCFGMHGVENGGRLGEIIVTLDILLYSILFIFLTILISFMFASTCYEIDKASETSKELKKIIEDINNVNRRQSFNIY